MKTLLINPPYQTITSNWGVGHQVPLGLLMVGGALRDAGFATSLLDAEATHLRHDQIAEAVRRTAPDVVMTGHAGSTPAHPVCMAMLARIKRARPETLCVYGGVFPTYHAEPILRQHPYVDVVVRGERRPRSPYCAPCATAPRSTPSTAWCSDPATRWYAHPTVRSLTTSPLPLALILHSCTVQSQTFQHQCRRRSA